MNRVFFTAIFLFVVFFTACKSNQSVSVNQVKKDISLPTGYWNSDDSKHVAER